MAIPMKPTDPNADGKVAGSAGNMPGTERCGVVFLEYVNVERKSGGVWSQVFANLPATFEPISLFTRAQLQAWTHKPLLCLWLMPDAAVQDGDRIVRSDGSHWYIRGMPLLAPGRTHIAALAEYATEDKLFATLSPSEPS